MILEYWQALILHYYMENVNNLFNRCSLFLKLSGDVIPFKGRSKEQECQGFFDDMFKEELPCGRTPSEIKEYPVKYRNDTRKYQCELCHNAEIEPTSAEDMPGYGAEESVPAELVKKDFEFVESQNFDAQHYFDNYLLKTYNDLTINRENLSEDIKKALLSGYSSFSIGVAYANCTAKLKFFVIPMVRGSFGMVLRLIPKTDSSRQKNILKFELNRLNGLCKHKTIESSIENDELFINYSGD